MNTITFSPGGPGLPMDPSRPGGPCEWNSIGYIGTIVSKFTWCIHC